MESQNCSNPGGDEGALRVLKLAVGVACVGAARPLLDGSEDLLECGRRSNGQDRMLGSLLAMLLVSAGVALLFGVYRGCRWCRLLSWMGWLLLPAVTVFFLSNALCRSGLYWEDPLKQGALLNHALRYVAPVVLLTWMWSVRKGSVPLGGGGLWMLRGAAAATFLGHGLNALRGSPSHVELIQLTFGAGVSDPMAEIALDVIGCVDVLAAVLVLAKSWRWLALWMAAWGMVAVASRLTAYGIAGGWDAAAIRACNAGVPLVIWMVWRRSAAGRG